MSLAVDATILTYARMVWTLGIMAFIVLSIWYMIFTPILEQANIKVDDGMPEEGLTGFLERLLRMVGDPGSAVISGSSVGFLITIAFAIAPRRVQSSMRVISATVLSSLSTIGAVSLVSHANRLLSLFIPEITIIASGIQVVAVVLIMLYFLYLIDAIRPD